MHCTVLPQPQPGSPTHLLLDIHGSWGAWLALVQKRKSGSDDLVDEGDNNYSFPFIELGMWWMRSRSARPTPANFWEVASREPRYTYFQHPPYFSSKFTHPNIFCQDDPIFTDSILMSGPGPTSLGVNPGRWFFSSPFILPQVMIHWIRAYFYKRKGS